MSYSAKLTLLKACLASIPIYLMSVIRFPKWAIKVINSHMSNFFWDNLGTIIGITLLTSLPCARGKRLGV
jgi:hypothetical protein